MFQSPRGGNVEIKKEYFLKTEKFQSPRGGKVEQHLVTKIY